ncbi:MAG: protein meaA, partial [Halieaceae bacterium]|nr:protein meaA [Halieaceae bacterium]
EGVHLIGLSVLSGSHLELVEAIHLELAAIGASHIPIVIGGIIPEDDAKLLVKNGLKAVFTPKDSDMNDIMDRMVDIIRETNGLEPDV